LALPKLDTHVAISPTEVRQRGGSPMQIPDEIRKCVAFVCYKTTKDTKEMNWAGTAFFVGVPLQGTQLDTVYIVTAKHIIEGIKAKSIDQTAYLRMNSKTGPSRLVATPIDKWIFHPQESNADVAVLNWAPSQEKYDYLSLPVKYAGTEDIIKKENIGLGDDVFLVGLFANHFGSQRNLPIIRVGNIASMPEEKVYTKKYGYIDAYLVEARSIGGLSGSPVFVWMGNVRKIGETTHLGRTGLPLLYWLGLMHGHFALSEIDLQINMGIAIVVPTWKILEVINQEAFTKARKMATKKEPGNSLAR
jgi:hypothetical protein